MNRMDIFLPEGVRNAIKGVQFERQSIGRSSAYVFDCGEMFLKIDADGRLARAAAMQEYFAKKGLGAPVLAYERCDGQDFLLMKRTPGEYACGKMLSEPETLAEKLGEAVRALHETPAADCPLGDVNERMLLAYEKEHGGPLSGVQPLKKDALVHGDCCLPNIFFEGGRFTGFIDLGDAGLGDRHLDLASVIWSLEYNTGTAQWRDAFLDAYGREKIDTGRLETCARIWESA